MEGIMTETVDVGGDAIHSTLRLVLPSPLPYPSILLGPIPFSSPQLTSLYPSYPLHRRHPAYPDPLRRI
eukprot:5767125-Pyramimonas_sp.AAC.1